jgi:hypothetical protein
LAPGLAHAMPMLCYALPRYAMAVTDGGLASEAEVAKVVP